MKRSVLFYLMVLLIAAGCKHKPEVTYKEVQVPGKFTLQVPTFMEATTELFKEGKTSLQYQNDSLKVYLIGFDTGRNNLNEKTLKDYYDSVAPRPNENGAVIDTCRYVKINGDSAIITSMIAAPGGNPAYYKIATIATPDRFFYLMIWCPKNGREEMKEVFDKVLNSFHDVNHVKT